MLKLWKMAYNQSLVCSIFIGQFHTIHTKLSYFGRHMMTHDNESRQIQLYKKFNNPSFIKLLHPETQGHFLWDISQLFLLLYTALYAPYRTAFMSYTSSTELLVFETICDLLFMMDIFVSFLTPYERQDGSKECNIKKIAIHYCLSQLAVDVQCVFPTEFIEMSVRPSLPFLNHADQNTVMQRSGLIRIIRITKLLKLGKYNALVFRLIDQYLQLKPTEARVLVVCSVSFFIVHIFACLFYIIARVKNFDSSTWVGNNRYLTVDDTGFQAYYFVMYWAFQTLTTVGYGDFGAYNGLEIGLTCIWMFLGVAFYSFVVGSLTTLFTSANYT